MLAIIALILFLVSPWIPDLGPWPTVTMGLAFVAAHLVWYLGAPFLRARPAP